MFTIVTSSSLANVKIYDGAEDGSKTTTIIPYAVTDDTTHWTFTITEWCTSTTPCPAGLKNLNFYIVGFQNYHSTKPTNQRVQIVVKDSSGKKIDQGKDLIPELLSAGPLKNVQISRDTNVIGAACTYTFKFQLTFNVGDVDGAYFRAQMAPGMMYQGASLTCSATDDQRNVVITPLQGGGSICNQTIVSN